MMVGFLTRFASSMKTIIVGNSQAILDQAKILTREGVKAEDFLRMKRSALGRRIRDLDSFDATCYRTCACQLTGFDYFRFPGVYASIQAEEIRAFVEEVVREENSCLSVIEPISKEEEA